MSELAGPNPFEDSPKTHTPLGIKSVFEGLLDFNLSFSQTEDLGNLGIFDVDHLTQKLNLLCDEPERESLGIINLSSLDLGRESLGITNIKNIEFGLLNGSLPKIPEETYAISEDNAEEFNDAVFMEASHIAGRIADGSFVRAGNDTIDSEEPDCLVDTSNEEAATKRNTEGVFKFVDKRFGRSDPDQNVPSEDNISQDNDINLKSLDAIGIINSLSTILSNDILDDKQKSKGKSLLSSLTDILLSSQSTREISCSLENNSAVTSQTDQSSEILDLRKRSNSDTNLNRRRYEVITPLDLSIKSTSVYANSKFNKNQEKVNSSVGNGYSISSNDSNHSMKFKLKKGDGARKGPMRAVIPINNMAKDGVQVKITPKRSEFQGLRKLKKETTPISESNMKPMAQSTPDNLRYSCPSSPVARPNSSLPSSPKMLKRRFSSPKLPQPKTVDINKKRSSLLKGPPHGGEPVTKTLDKNTRSSLVKGVSNGSDFNKKQNVQKPLAKSYRPEQKSGIAKHTLHRNSLPGLKTAAGGSVLKENRNRSVERPAGIRKSGKEN